MLPRHMQCRRLLERGGALTRQQEEIEGVQELSGHLLDCMRCISQPLDLCKQRSRLERSCVHMHLDNNHRPVSMQDASAATEDVQLGALYVEMRQSQALCPEEIIEPHDR